MSRWNFKSKQPRERSRGQRGDVAPGAAAYRERNGTLVLSSVGTDAGYEGSDPTYLVANRIRDALDPSKTPSRVKTFAEMTPEEKAEMQRLYGGGK